jgi:acetyl-CoA/propionyl-CoA carboxylase carboxyl transferase subunit
MNSKSLGATRVVAWPTAEIAVMGAVAAVRVLHRRKLAEAPPEQVPALEQELAAEHEQLAGGLGRAVEIGVVDAVVAPERTRAVIAEALRSAPPARGRHGNIPL